MSHNGVVDVKEGTTLTLSCDNPGNTNLGTTFYQWFNSTGGKLTNKVSSPPLNLPFNNIQKQSSGLYICQSTKDIVPDITMSNVTINVQCKLIFFDHLVLLMCSFSLSY